MIYLICTIYEEWNADNATTFRIWSDNKLHELYAMNDFSNARK